MVSTRYTSIDISLKNGAQFPHGACLYLSSRRCGISKLSSCIAFSLAPSALFLYSRFVWDCKGSIIHYSCQIYFKVFLISLGIKPFLPRPLFHPLRITGLTNDTLLLFGISPLKKTLKTPQKTSRFLSLRDAKVTPFALSCKTSQLIIHRLFLSGWG